MAKLEAEFKANFVQFPIIRGVQCRRDEMVAHSFKGVRQGSLHA